MPDHVGRSELRLRRNARAGRAPACCSRDERDSRRGRRRTAARRRVRLPIPRRHRCGSAAAAPCAINPPSSEMSLNVSIVCALPSSTISKSVGLRSATGLPLLSVTMTSTRTKLIPARNTGWPSAPVGGGGACGSCLGPAPDGPAAAARAREPRSASAATSDRNGGNTKELRHVRILVPLPANITRCDDPGDRAFTPAADPVVRRRAALPRQRVRVRRPRGPAATCARWTSTRGSSPGRSSRQLFDLGVMGIEIPEASAAPARRSSTPSLPSRRCHASIRRLASSSTCRTRSSSTRSCGGAPTSRSSGCCRGSPPTPSARMRCRKQAPAATRSRWRRAPPAQGGDDWVLNGRKLWITNGNEAGIFIVFANVNPSRRLPRDHGVPRRARHAGIRGRQEGRQARDSRQQHLRTAVRRVPGAGCRTCLARSAKATRPRSRR